MIRYDRIARQLMLGVCIAALGGCRYGAIGGAETCDPGGGKDAHSFADDFMRQLDCYVNEVRKGFNDNGFEPTLKEYKSHFRVVHTDGRTFFSYRAECFIDTGRWLHGGETVKVGTIDVRTGKRLTTADVIPADKRNEAIARVRKAVIAKIGGEENLMPSANEVLATLPENFYVGKDGLHFIFPEYSVAPYHYAPDLYGPVEVVVPAYRPVLNRAAK